MSVLQESRLETQNYYRKTSTLGGCCWYYAFVAVIITTTKTTTTTFSASKNNRFFGVQEWRPFCKEVLQAEITHYAAITYRWRFVADIATKMHSRGLSVIQEHRNLRASDEFFLAWGKLSTNEGGSCAVRCTIVGRRRRTQSRFSWTTVSFCLLENPVLTSLSKKKLENDGFRESYSWRRNSCCSWLGFCFVWGELQQALLWSKTSLW